MSGSTPPVVQAVLLPRPRCAAAQIGSRLRLAIGLCVAATLGAVLTLVAALASDPVILARLGGRLQVMREGGEFQGRSGLTLQAGLHDCGPAALANLLAELGLDPPPLDSLARFAGTGPTGTRTSGLIRAAGTAGVSLVRWTGPSVAGQSNAPDSELSGDRALFPIPSIAWVRESHFVTVASQRTDGRLTILDPLVGQYAMVPADFRRIWSGGVLLVPQESPPLVATTVAAPFPLAGGFHAKSVHSSARVVPHRRLHHAPSSGGE